MEEALLGGSGAQSSGRPVRCDHPETLVFVCSTPETLGRLALPAPHSSIKQETIDEEEEVPESEDEDENNHGEDVEDEANPEVRLIRQQIKFLARLPTDVVLKTNKMVAITVQKSPTLWILPPTLRSLLNSLVSLF